MFERRLRILLVLPVVCGLVILGRLYQLQVVRGEHYAARAQAALISPKQFLPPLRGRILDRQGRVLVSDEPAHDVTVHYGLLSMNESYLLMVADELRRTVPSPAHASNAELHEAAQRQVGAFWRRLSDVTGVSLKVLRERRDTITANVERLRRHIHRVRGKAGQEAPLEEIRLREEMMFHPIVRDVSAESRTRIELEWAQMPFVRIEASVRRVWDERAEPMCHLLGRLGQVAPSMIEEDPFEDDWLMCYRPGEQVGVDGLERLGEMVLRGKRGFEERDLDGRLVDSAPPIDGPDLEMTVDFDLQARIAEILRRAVAEHPPSTGASCVVVDTRTREILAMVSVPTFSRGDLQERYAALRDDLRGCPLRFRAVSEEYQPGSILKPVALLAGLASGVVSARETIQCDGSFIPGSTKWHCWTHWRGMAGHGPLCAEEAIQHSCNVYFYTVGQRMGSRRLTEFYESFLLGMPLGGSGPIGTGLIEERDGLIPTDAWLAEHRGRKPQPADGRNYAIGQGEMQITPLQAANMFATLAMGEDRSPTLIANDGRARPGRKIPGVTGEAWNIVRRGMLRCVNEPGGTAYAYAHMEDLQVCGKTGSAQCVPRVTERRYTFRAADESIVRIVAPTIEAARERLGLTSSVECTGREAVSRWPPPVADKDEPPTHSWFAGYAPYHDPRIALAVIVEYGGGGGHTAGPVAREILEMLRQSPGGYLPESSPAPAVSEAP